MRSNHLWLFIMEVFAGLSRGSYLVCIGWTTLVVTGEVAVVGQVFILAMLANMLGGPLLGTIVDRKDRRVIAALAHLGVAGVMLGGGAALAFGWTTPLLFFAVAFGAQLLRLLYQLAHDALIRANAEDAEVMVLLARLRTTHLLATTVGTIAAGWVIHAFGAFAGFAGSALTSFGVIFAARYLAVAIKSAGGPKPLTYLAELSVGFRTFRTNPEIRVAALLALVVLPVGQLSNAVLSGLIRNDLGHGSDVFGLVDAAWPVGGMVAAGVMSLGLAILQRNWFLFVTSGFAGLATAVLGVATTVPVLVLLHGLMGFFVWLTHISVDACVLRASTEQTAGRMKSYIVLLLSAGAIVMCLSPGVVPVPEVGRYFQFWGCVAASVSGFLLLWHVVKRMRL